MCFVPISWNHYYWRPPYFAKNQCPEESIHPPIHLLCSLFPVQGHGSRRITLWFLLDVQHCHITAKCSAKTTRLLKFFFPLWCHSGNQRFSFPNVLLLRWQLLPFVTNLFLICGSSNNIIVSAGGYKHKASRVLVLNLTLWKRKIIKLLFCSESCESHSGFVKNTLARRSLESSQTLMSMHFVQTIKYFVLSFFSSFF